MAVIEGVAVLRKMIQMRITYERLFVTYRKTDRVRAVLLGQLTGY